MFNNLDKQNPAGNSQVDDIFAETDQANSGPADIETRRVGLASGATINSQGANLQDEMAKSMMDGNIEPSSKSSKGYSRWIIIGVIVIAFLGAAYFVYSQFFNIKEPINSLVENENILIVEEPNNIQESDFDFVEIIPEFLEEEITPIGDIVLEENEEDNNNFQFGDPDLLNPNNNIVPEIDLSPNLEADFVPAVDSDGDGLSDDEELSLKTNPNSIDSDNDGLSDYEEVYIYYTNPLNQDTDGDGYLDGDEVKSGYDPLVGGGKLLNSVE